MLANLSKYNKLWTFLLTAALTFVPYYFPHLPEWWNAVVLILGAYGIYRVPNVTTVE